MHQILFKSVKITNLQEVIKELIIFNLLLQKLNTKRFMMKRFIHSDAVEQAYLLFNNYVYANYLDSGQLIKINIKINQLTDLH